MVERRSPKPDVEGSSPSWPVTAAAGDRLVDRGCSPILRKAGPLLWPVFPKCLRGRPRRKEPLVKKIVQFVKDCVAELKKVVWPSRDDVVASVKVVVASTVVMAVILGALDFVFVAGIDFIFR